MSTSTGACFQDIRNTIDQLENDVLNPLLYIPNSGSPDGFGNDHTIAAMKTLLQEYEPVLRFSSNEAFLPMSAMLFMFASHVWKTPTGLGFNRSLYAYDVPPYCGNDYEIQMQDYCTRDGQKIETRLHDKLTWLLTESADMRVQMDFLYRGRDHGATHQFTTSTNHADERAKEKYNALVGDQPQPCYYGRIADYVPDEGQDTDNRYRVLQYWFFYAFNDWLPPWHIGTGLNWHEGDWESVSVFGRIRNNVPSDYRPVNFLPICATYAAHNLKGDRIRQCWDEVSRVDETHPVVYVSHGAHGSYYAGGQQNRKIGMYFDRADDKGSIVAHQTYQHLPKRSERPIYKWGEPRLILDQMNCPEWEDQEIPRHWLSHDSNWGGVPAEGLKRLISVVYAGIRSVSGGILNPRLVVVRLQDGPEGLLDPNRETANLLRWAGIDKLRYSECQSFLHTNSYQLIPPLLPELDCKGFNSKVALWLAHAANLAYAGKQSVINRLRESGGMQAVHFFDTESTQGFLAATITENDTAVCVLVFRGTEKDYFDILTDFNIFARKIPDEKFQAHGGFVNAVHAVLGTSLRFKSQPPHTAKWWATEGITNCIQQLSEKHQSVRLFITGHSLGGALATLAAHHLSLAINARQLENVELVGLYTFGAPKVAGEDLRRQLNFELNGRSFRLVNGFDIVARLAPSIAGYRHNKQRIFLLVWPPLFHREKLANEKDESDKKQTWLTTLLFLVLDRFILLLALFVADLMISSVVHVPKRIATGLLPENKLQVALKFGLTIGLLGTVYLCLLPLLGIADTSWRDFTTTKGIIAIVIFVLAYLYSTLTRFPLTMYDHRIGEYISILDKMVRP